MGRRPRTALIGSWELAPDEALIIEVTPPEGLYWSYSWGTSGGRHRLRQPPVEPQRPSGGGGRRRIVRVVVAPSGSGCRQLGSTPPGTAKVRSSCECVRTGPPRCRRPGWCRSTGWPRSVPPDTRRVSAGRAGGSHRCPPEGREQAVRPMTLDVDRIEEEPGPDGPRRHRGDHYAKASASGGGDERGGRTHRDRRGHAEDALEHPLGRPDGVEETFHSIPRSTTRSSTDRSSSSACPHRTTPSASWWRPTPSSVRSGRGSRPRRCLRRKETSTPIAGSPPPSRHRHDERASPHADHAQHRGRWAHRVPEPHGDEFPDRHFDGFARVPSTCVGCRHRHEGDLPLSPAGPAPAPVMPTHPLHLKTPVHMFALDALVEAYPNARFLWSHRDPAKVIGSVCSLIHYTRSWSSDRDDSIELGARATRPVVARRRRAMDFRERTGDDRFADISFSELQTDPVAALERGLTPDRPPLRRSARSSVAEWAGTTNRRHGTHPIKLSEFGLEPIRSGSGSPRTMPPSMSRRPADPPSGGWCRWLLCARPPRHRRWRMVRTPTAIAVRSPVGVKVTWVTGGSGCRPPLSRTAAPSSSSPSQSRSPRPRTMGTITMCMWFDRSAARNWRTVSRDLHRCVHVQSTGSPPGGLQASAGPAVDEGKVVPPPSGATASDGA